MIIFDFTVPAKVEWRRIQRLAETGTITYEEAERQFVDFMNKNSTARVFKVSIVPDSHSQPKTDQ